MSNNIVGAIIGFSLVVVPAALLAKNDPPEISPDGLELVEKDRRGEIYADPGVDWSVYDQIRLDTATVAFRKNWQRDQNRPPQSFKVKTEDMERIKAEMSELFDQVFTDELTGKGDYTLDTRNAGMTRSYTEQAGRMTLKLEIYDSVTGDLIATASDRQEAPRRGYMQWTTSVSNKAEARRMLERWAKDLHKRLDEASTSSN